MLVIHQRCLHMIWRRKAALILSFNNQARWLESVVMNKINLKRIMVMHWWCLDRIHRRIAAVTLNFNKNTGWLESVVVNTVNNERIFDNKDWNNVRKKFKYRPEFKRLCWYRVLKKSRCCFKSLLHQILNRKVHCHTHAEQA